jgi:putative ABC transport system substrate-binding protein
VRAANPLRRIGVLSSLPLPAPEETRHAWEPLREYGWEEGRDFTVHRRYANGDSRLLRSFAAELVKLGVDMILCIGTEATLAAREATPSIPIVMLLVGDPVGVGVVASLSKPGGNVTGYSSAFPELDAKRASLLKELIPSVKSVGVLFNPSNPLFRLNRAHSENTYRQLGIAALYAEVTSPDRIAVAVDALAQQRVQALVVQPDGMLSSNAVAILSLAQRYGLPTVVQSRYMAELGGLISYQASAVEQQARVIATIDKILRGAHPADIPVELPTQYELIINLKTAKALGVTIPGALMLRANELIR